MTLPELRIVEITEEPADLKRLREFYRDLCVGEFPDPDERESVSNMEDYLRLKAQGWYGPNSYHILVALAGETIVAGVVADYLAQANAGFIEFLTVVPARRRHGIGGRMLAALEERLEADAHRAHGRPFDYVIAEMNDPFLTDAAADNLDPFVRAGIWPAGIYRVIDSPYLQPALSVEQHPIRTLCLMAKPAIELPAIRLTPGSCVTWRTNISAGPCGATRRTMRRSSRPWRRS